MKGLIGKIGELLMAKHENAEVSMVGYGTFITKHMYEQSSSVEVCFIPQFRRILPSQSNPSQSIPFQSNPFQSYAYPFVLPDLTYQGFFALKFDVSFERLAELDKYEGVDSGLYDRIKINVWLRKQNKTSAFIYIPSSDTQKKLNLTLSSDSIDRWKANIEQDKKTIIKYPELLWDAEKLQIFFGFDKKNRQTTLDDLK